MSQLYNFIKGKSENQEIGKYHTNTFHYGSLYLYYVLKSVKTSFKQITSLFDEMTRWQPRTLSMRTSQSKVQINIGSLNLEHNIPPTVRSLA